MANDPRKLMHEVIMHAIAGPQPIAIPMEDPIIHTPEHPFCGPNNNPDWQTCPCHDIQETQYYELICRPLLDGLMTAEEANRLYFGDNPLDSLSHDDIDQVEAYRREYELDQSGTHAPDCRCAWCEPQERNATTQCSDGSWW